MPRKRNGGRDTVFHTLQPRMDKGKVTQTYKSWKPVTLRPATLVAIALISTALIVLLEILSAQTKRTGAVTIAASTSTLSAQQQFLFNSLPTIIAVLFGICWSWIDLDVKRLEPYFQLSRKGGSLGSDSLLLHYPFDFLATVPIRAAKHRHWSVFLAGTTTVLIFWAITPLQSAILSLEDVLITEPQVVMERSSGLIPLQTQSLALTAEVMYSVYGISWLGEKLQPYMTREYALAPFQPVNASTVGPENTTWSALTTLYQSDLNCSPAILGNDTYGDTVLSNGQGCNFSGLTGLYPTSADFQAQYIGYWPTQDRNNYLGSDPTSCPSNSSHNFLAIWASKATVPINGSTFTASYCVPKYYTQDVYATVTPDGNEVLSVDPRGPRTPISQESFNNTAFEAMISGSLNVLDQRRDFPASEIPTKLPLSSITMLDPHLTNLSLEIPTGSNMISFALAATEKTAASYIDPQLLQQSLQASQRLLFARAISSLMNPSTENGTRINGLEQYRTSGIVVVRPFAIAVEVCLALVAVLALSLLAVNVRRKLNLEKDPGSIGGTMELVCKSRDLISLCQTHDQSDEDRLEEHLKDESFVLTYDRGSPCLDRVPLGVSRRRTARKIDVPDTPTTVEHPVMPLELKSPVLIFFGCFLLGLALAIILLHRKITSENGLSLPSRNQAVQQLLLNYLPTAVSMFIEPVWVIVNRCLCIIQPFEELRTGKAKASASLQAMYTSLPPQLTFLRAATSGHLLLSVVCGMAIGANILAVAFSSLFLQTAVPVTYQTHFTQQLSPLFQDQTDLMFNVSFWSHFYVEDIVDNKQTPLPPWTTADYYFLPYNASQLNATKSTAVTTGFGINTTCIQLLDEGSSTVNFTLTPDARSANLFVQLQQANGTSLQCQTRDVPTQPFTNGNYEGVLASGGNLGLGGWPNSTTALELSVPMAGTDLDGNSSAGECENIIVNAWLRYVIDLEFARDGTRSANVNAYSRTFMACQPQLLVAQFEVTVDDTGMVTNYTQKGPFIEDVTPYFSNHSANLFSQTNALLAANAGIWHNDSFPSDWQNYLLAQRGVGNALDPEDPVPAFDDIYPPIAQLQNNLFAIFLGLNSERMFLSANSSTVHGAMVVSETHVFMEQSMFIISVAILFLYVLTTALLYTRRPKRFLPRMPTTLASMFPFFAASHLLKEVGCRRNAQNTSELDVLDDDVKFGYGAYIGVDGKTHIGIEKEPFFVPVDFGKTSRSYRLRCLTKWTRGWTGHQEDRDGTRRDSK